MAAMEKNPERQVMAELGRTTQTMHLCRHNIAPHNIKSTKDYGYPNYVRAGSVYLDRISVAISGALW